MSELKLKGELVFLAPLYSGCRGVLQGSEGFRALSPWTLNLPLFAVISGRYAALFPQAMSCTLVLWFP